MIWPTFVTASSSLCRLDVRLARLERALHLHLSDEDVAAIRASGNRTPARLGAYYHWYLQKALAARIARTATPGVMHRLLDCIDRTDYTALNGLVEPSRGLLVCIPHHGHYVLSILGLLRHFRSRERLVFYSAPAIRPGNALFDDLHRRLCDGDGHFRVVHDTTKGIADVLRGLKRGAVVLLMPDATRAASSPFLIPFAGRQMPVMLGPAVLARRTGARVLPAVSRVEIGHPEFRTALSTPMEYGSSVANDGAQDEQFNDYRFVLELFRRLETAMEDQFIHWQHVRSHFAQRAAFPSLDAQSGRIAIKAFFKDPRMRAAFRKPIVLDPP